MRRWPAQAPAAELEKVKPKAIALGAYDAVVIDARERFVDDYVQPGACRQRDISRRVSAFGRAFASVDRRAAGRNGAAIRRRAVAHGCTGKGNDQVRIELAVRALDPSLTVRAPLRERPLSRPDAIAFAREHGIPIAHSAAKPYSIDANLWGRSIEAGVLEDPWNAPPEDAFAWTAAPEARPAQPDDVMIEFERRRAVVRRTAGVELVAQLNALAGKHGIGRIDMVEDRVIGVKSREVYEAPGAVVLIAAHTALERLVLTRDELRFKATLRSEVCRA